MTLTASEATSIYAVNLTWNEGDSIVKEGHSKVRKKRTKYKIPSRIQYINDIMMEIR